MPVRRNRLPDGTFPQQSMTRNKSQYKVENMTIPMLGVVMAVRPSDDVKNRSAMEFSDYRGFVPECDVYIVADNFTLPNVLITPDAPCGLDDFYERLPRASSALVDGTPLSSSLGGLNPAELDGDWCIVSFFKGKIDSPYIQRWWPNPNNRFDPATSGKAFPNKITGEGTALEQAGRYFNRINGVECVITTAGNINISTRFSNSKVDFQASSPLSKVGKAVAGENDTFKLPSTEGRPSREEREDGGSVRLQVKPSQTFEIDFAPQIDGMGWDDLSNEELPQTNPHILPSLPPNRTIPQYSYLIFDKDQVSIDVPLDFKVNSNSTVTINALTNTTITSPQIHLVALDEVVIGTNISTEYLALGTQLVKYLGTPGIIASPMGPLSLTPPNPLQDPTWISGWDSLISDKHKVQSRIV